MGILYVVATPIGNLGDFSKRAIETLKMVDFIAAEDTRVTMKLLNRFDIKKSMISYYEHNLREKGQYICDRILNGENCAIVSDAGMPCVSDPGEDLVRLCAEQNIEVRVIPGGTAAVSALALSGLSTSRFTFEGFLSVNKRSRTEHLASLKTQERTMIFYEAPHKLLTTLKDMSAVFGDERRITLAREITKLHEQVLRMTLSQAVLFYEETAPRGEFVLVIEGYKKMEDKQALSLDEVIAQAKEAIANGEKATEVAKRLSKEYGFLKNDIYKSL